ncbi:hypothetical protein BaRGS_00006529 [Batillaria attramentaria]|uniref:RING finger and CHY zinc finger domain-containing protein 1 n=1 Tax=Batillaria attramentaria TaxID=370345 RepID=A0ABD0LRK2_9CAEN
MAGEEGAQATDHLGCEHYNRNCALIAPCCKKQYTCRICHDEKEMHELDRHQVCHVVCLKCNLEQEVAGCCKDKNCGNEFGKYFCERCRLFDNDDKNQFHCDKCGICRVGGRENFFHCDKCNVCLALLLKDNHKCVANMSHDACPVCLEDLHSSRKQMHIPPCGHLLHLACYKDLFKAGHFACPNCNQSMINMTDVWKEVDREVSETEMPEEYRNVTVDIICRDCQKKSQTKFHVLGLKCEHCGSYNTAR